MLIDVHADVGAWAFRRLWVEEPDGLLELMAEQGIAAAVVGPVEGITYRNPQAANERLFERLDAAGRPANLLPAAVINPAFPGWERDLEDAAAAGAATIKLYPNYHDYSPRDAAARELVAAATEKGLPVICCVRVEDERQQHWLMLVPPVRAADVAELAAAVDGAHVILACGNQGEIEAFLGAAPPERTWAEISYLKSPMFSLEHIVGKFGAERILFGTHAPFLDPGATRIKFERAELTDADREAIAWKNAAAIWPALAELS